MDRKEASYLEGKEALRAAVRVGRITRADEWVGSTMNLLACGEPDFTGDQERALRRCSYEELAKWLRVTPATVGRHVRALMAAGLVRRVQGAGPFAFYLRRGAQRRAPPLTSRATPPSRAGGRMPLA